MTPREAIFTSMVRDGLRRAYRAVERVERERGIWIDVWLEEGNGQLSPDGDPPEVMFFYQGNDVCDVTLPIDSSFGKFYEFVERMVVKDDAFGSGCRTDADLETIAYDATQRDEALVIRAEVERMAEPGRAS
jgi:hypothetical protein